MRYFRFYHYFSKTRKKTEFQHNAQSKNTIFKRLHITGKLSFMWSYIEDFDFPEMKKPAAGAARFGIATDPPP